MAIIPRPDVVRLLLCSISVHVICCCVFPEQFQGKTWYTNIRPSMRKQTAVYFRGNLMELQDEQTDKVTSLKTSERKCITMLDIGKYIIYYNFPEQASYSCLVFITRSVSLIQLRFSKRFQQRSANICDESNLTADEQLLVSYADMQQEFTPCPFSGGYNMKITDKTGRANGCNFMDLPMRFESECHTGEGITMNFRDPTCVNRMPMSEMQSAICIAHWRDDGDVISIIRKAETNELWCLRIPARASFSGKITMLLFTDFVCSIIDADVIYHTLELEMVLQLTLCADEHTNCERLPCNSYFDSQCYKSCGKCDPNVYPTTCDLPRRLRGDWFVNDNNGVKQINISESRMHIEQLGDFDCVTFPDSPSRKTRQFTTVSFFTNGCRPRYTCIGFKRISPNSFGYAVSQSRVWPLLAGSDAIGATVCDAENFKGDPSPIKDSYRTYNDVYKPMVTSSGIIEPQSCALTSSYVFNVTFRPGRTCSGWLYQDCDDSTRMRIEFIEHCPESDGHIDFSCIGNVEGKYWQKLMLIQNVKDYYDTRCIVFNSIDKHRILVLPSGECDKYSWDYVTVGLRTPELDLTVTAEDSECRSITTPAITHAPEPVNDAWRVESPDNKQKYKDSERNQRRNSKHPSYMYNTTPLYNKNNKNKGKQSRDVSDGHNRSGSSPSVFHASLCASILLVTSLATLHNYSA